MEDKSKRMNLQEIQQVSLGIMKKIDEISRKIDVSYFLMYGTLLGCIRHQGFIPWDDDVDIAMPRADYDRFCRYFREHREELAPYELHNRETVENYPYYISRVCDNRYDVRFEHSNYHSGIFVDLYPFDGMGNDGDKAYWRCNRRRFMFYQKGASFAAMDESLFIGKNVLTKCLNRFLIPYCKSKGTAFFLEKIEKYGSKYTWEESKYVGDPMWDVPLYIEKKDVERENLIYMNFEGTPMSVPKAYDKILRLKYGEYMVLPPDDEQQGHHCYEAYRK